MDPLVVAAIVTGIVSMITAGVGTAVNATQQNQTNMKNEELLRESWQRDDSQMQRAKADAQAAGFSPLAALGNMPGNTNPTQMQPVQIDTNGIQNALGGTVDRVAQRKAQITQDKLTEAQVEQAEEETEAKKLDNLIRLAKAYDEIYGAKLDNYDKIGLLLDAKVITKDELPEAYKNLKENEAEKKNREIAQQNANAATASANEQKRHNITEETSTRETNEAEAEYSFNFLGNGIKLKYKHTDNGQYMPITSGITPASKPWGTYASAYPTDIIKKLTGNNKDGVENKYFAGHTADGLPVIKNAAGTYFVIVPTGKSNAKIYKIDEGEVAKSTYGQWTSKYWNEYYKLLNNLANSEAFKN